MLFQNNFINNRKKIYAKKIKTMENKYVNNKSRALEILLFK